MKKICPVCGLPVEELPAPAECECIFCHKKMTVTAECAAGHHVCAECRESQGLAAIMEISRRSVSANPVEIAVEMMEVPYIHMHGKEHHVLFGLALLTAYHNAGGRVDMERARAEMEKRGRQVPAGVCGLWGACGAAVSAGMFVSIITGATSLAEEEWKLANLMTAKALERIGEIGGPRCCKRDGMLAIITAADYCKEHFNVAMELPATIRCRFKHRNRQCIRERCPFF